MAELPGATTSTAAQPAPDFAAGGIERWHCTDGIVVADHDRRRRGIYFYSAETTRLVQDPEQLAAAMVAAHATLDETKEDRHD